MDLVHYVIFACLVYLAIVLGRKSMKYDMRQRFASIEEQGQSLRTAGDVVNCILQLRESVEHLKNENKALTNSLNIAKAAGEKLERDYKTLLGQLREKREECEALVKHLQTQKDLIKDKNSKIVGIFEDFNSWMLELWNMATAIKDSACEHNGSIIEYDHYMDKAKKKFIYATELLNKSHLLSIGEVEVQKNGSIKYSEGSRSLGNYSSKENWAWLNDLNPLRRLPYMKPRESKRIALIIDYFDYKMLSAKYNGVFKSSTDIFTESDKMLDYMRGIKSKFGKLVAIS